MLAEKSQWHNPTDDLPDSDLPSDLPHDYLICYETIDAENVNNNDENATQEIFIPNCDIIFTNTAEIAGFLELICE